MGYFLEDKVSIQQHYTTDREDRVDNCGLFLIDLHVMIQGTCCLYRYDLTRLYYAPNMLQVRRSGLTR